ncbi:hypothetical protein EJ08DRAFT_94085 [Tothia fuscella]|uniref:HTH CENPB-type domain-containing protein n=1 Tax=Tothia fuscella TaxID=1048955 RepID=A0A9P4NVR3_9PEZI|nr:hypothetical protein EJ08DRAFT_94085 [Tothia fuscella]
MLRMEHEHHQEPGYAGYHDGNSQQWDGGFHSQHQSPVQEHNGFGFTPLPMEPMYSPVMSSMPPPPRTTYQQLQPLITPQWPSMLTSQSQSSYHTPLFPSAPIQPTPISTPVSAPATAGRSSSNPRKTLTDADRRRMCVYAEEHPTVKQTEIGAMFGVERSTVSKVLRNKEKYLYQDDGSRSPVRKAKGKFPDIERALSNWAKNHQKQGLPMSDALIKEKLRFFSMSVGSTESQLKASNSSWLEKFKQKNNLMGSKSRKNSVAEDSEGPSLPGSGTQTPNISPTSPPPAGGKEMSPSAMSVSKHEDSLKMESPEEHYSEFAAHGGPYRSMSNASLASGYNEGSSSFSPGPQSPTSPFFSPDSASPFMSQSQSRLPSLSQQGGFSRPRSQTFPMVGIEPGSYVSPPSSEPLTPQNVSTTSLDSPLSELAPLRGVEAMYEPTSTMQPLHQPMVSSVAPHGLPLQALITHPQGHQHPSPITPNSAIGSMVPGSPSVEDTRRALEVVMNFFQAQQPGLVEPQEYMMMGKLMQKLKVNPAQLEGEMPGGMHRIPSGDFNPQGYISKLE